MSDPTHTFHDRRIDPTALIDAILRRRGWIIMTVAVCLLLALAYISFAAPKYTAVSQLLVDPRSLQIVGNDIAARTQTSDGSSLETESQTLILTSLTVLTEVIRREKLDTHPLFGAKPDGIVDFLRGKAPDETAFARAIRLLGRAVAVKRAERTYVIDIAVKTDDRQLAARIANAIVSIYLEKEGEARANAARRAAESLSSRLNELRANLRVAEEKAELFKRQNKILQSEGRPLVEVQLADISTQLTTERARINELRSKLEQIRLGRQRPDALERIPETLQSTTVAALRTQYSLAIRAEAEARTLYGPRHPTYVAAQSQAGTARRELLAEIDRVSSSIANDLSRAEVAEKGLNRQLESLRGQAAANSELLVRLRELTRDAEASRAVYEAFLVRARELAEQQKLDTGNSRVLSAALPPALPSGPPPILILIASILFGVALGSGLAWLRDRLATR